MQRAILPVILTIAIFICLRSVASAEQSTDSWQMFQHDVRHTAKTTYIGTTSNKVKWTYDIVGPTAVSPVLDNHANIYFGTGFGAFYSLKDKGSYYVENWSHTENLDHIESTAALGSDGTIYYISGDGYLYARRTEENTLVWKRYVGDYYVHSCPVITDNGYIFVVSDHGHLYSFHKNGDRNWSCFLSGGIHNSSAAIGPDGTIYVGTQDGYLYAVNSEGKVSWRYHAGQGIVHSPAVGLDGTVYVVSYTNGLLALNSDGTVKWQFSDCEDHSSTPPTIDESNGTVYFGTRGLRQPPHVFALDISNGSPKWKRELHGGPVQGITVDGNSKLYVSENATSLGYQSLLYLMSENSDIVWKIAFDYECTQTPSIGKDGTIYVIAGDLYAIGASEPGILETAFRD